MYLITRSRGPPGSVSSTMVRVIVPELVCLILSHSAREKPTPGNPLEHVNTIRPHRSYQVSRSFSWSVGTIVAFRLGLPDAEIIGKEFYPEVAIEDLISLPNYSIYLKLMIDGKVSRPFSAETMTVLN